MTLSLLVKVQLQVFTAKHREPQAENSDVQVKEAGEQNSEPTNRNLMRLNGG